MKKLLIMGLAAMAGWAFGVENKTLLKIMPLGDSITYGVGGSQSGYRYFLERDLIRDGFQVDYYGTSSENACTGLRDPNHCGFSGIYLKGNGSYNIHDGVAGWLAQTGAPDIILLHIGTNDAKDLEPLTDRPKALDETITTMVTAAPGAHIIVSTVLQRTDNASMDDNIRTNYNAYVEGIVSAHAAKGENVHYLDMRARLTYPNDLADGLHPNDSGYQKMAAAWLEEIEKIYAPEAVPTELRFATVVDKTHVQLDFTLPLAATMTELSHWSISDGATITAVELSTDACTATLTLGAELAGGAQYEVTCSNLVARNTATTEILKVPNLHLVGRGYSINVPESEWGNYHVIYSFTPADVVPAGDETSVYEVNRAGMFAGKKFDRVAYYMELQKTASDPLQYVWVSFKAFNDDLTQIGVPYNYMMIHQDVEQMNVFCNVEGVKCGTNMTGGSLEFWSGMYGVGDDGEFDCNDQYNGGSLGSMQIHNMETKTTMFAYNMWYWSDQAAGLGIGNCPKAQQRNADPDWTFSNNINSFSHKRIVIFAHFTEELDVPAFAVQSATYNGDAGTVVIKFSQPIDYAKLSVQNFVLPGFTIEDIAVNSTLAEVTLRGKVATEQDSTLTVQGVRDAVLQREIATFQTPVHLVSNVSADDVESAAIVSELTQYVGAETLEGWELLFAADIPVQCNVNNGYGINTQWQQENFYRKDRRVQFAAVDAHTERIAYCLVLEPKEGTTQYAWTAMDAFTQNVQQMAVPELGYYLQECVTNLDVKSNVAGVVNVTGSQSGIIEFTAGQYTMDPNQSLLPTIGDRGAYSFDWNDSGFSAAPENRYGCMQVHNWGDQQTVWAFNHFNDNNTPGLGIGNQSISGHTDWTLANNAADFTSRKLYGLVKRTITPPTAHIASNEYPLPANFAQVDEANEYKLLYYWQVPAQGISDYTYDGRAQIRGFDRVAFYFHLKDKVSVDKWVWTSMDAYTDNVNELGIPGKDARFAFRQKVNDLNVYASENIATLSVDQGGVVTGKHITTGNIEIHPSTFDRAPGLEGLGGDEGRDRYDWNDAPGNPDSLSFGQWQVSNYGAGNIIFNVGAFYWSSSSMGIGNNTDGSDSLDWTLSWNASAFLERDLYVLVRPKYEPWGDVTQFLHQPASVTLHRGESTTLGVIAMDATAWQWFKDGVAITGATQPTLQITDVDKQAKGSYKCLVSTATGASFSHAASVSSVSGTFLFVR